MLDLAIIGAGPAGLTAAIYAKRKGLSLAIFDSGSSGGKLNEIVVLENYPGFVSIKGLELAEKLREQLTNLNVEIKEFCKVKEILKEENGFKIVADCGKVSAKSVIIATGTAHRKLNAKGSEQFEGKGISYCATCDGPLHAGKDVAVIGGGNSGAMNALYLSKICNRVYLIEYMPKLKCEEAYLRKLKDANVKIITNAEVFEFFGKEVLEGLRYRDRVSQKQYELKVSGAFVYIGLKPNSELAKKLGCSLDDKGYIEVDQHMSTNMPGVFAAGDVTGIFQQLIVACAQGAIAAESAYRFLTD